MLGDARAAALRGPRCTPRSWGMSDKGARRERWRRQLSTSVKVLPAQRKTCTFLLAGSGVGANNASWNASQPSPCASATYFKKSTQEVMTLTEDKQTGNKTVPRFLPETYRDGRSFGKKL